MVALVRNQWWSTEECSSVKCEVQYWQSVVPNRYACHL